MSELLDLEGVLKARSNDLDVQVRTKYAGKKWEGLNHLSDYIHINTCDREYRLKPEEVKPANKYHGKVFRNKETLFERQLSRYSPSGTHNYKIGDCMYTEDELLRLFDILPMEATDGH